jgi:hypothetical protein
MIAPQNFTAPALRNVYTCEQFATEVLCGNRSTEWVQDMCKARRIKHVARRPYLIPQSEAVRFITVK